MSQSLLQSQRHQQQPLIGYYLPRKKFSKLRFDQFLLRCKHFHIDTIELNYDYLTQPNTRIPQLIIHKLEDDALSRVLIEKLRLLPKSSTIILDEFSSISRLLNRFEQYSLLNSNQNLYVVPQFICVSKDDNKLMIEKMLINNRVSFPIMCKPIQAHGDKSHDMKIIFDVQHLNDIDKPCVLQQFIDHDGVLFKVFAIGQNNYHIVQRNSIRNLHAYPSRETISFHSSEVSSSQADHILLSIDPSITITFNHEIVNKIAQTVQNLFELNLVGIDIIVDRNTGDYAVIDVNYFPGYEGVTDFSTQLFDLCQHLLHIS
ncbi:unnamed protein product [Rotaria socialis]|uniref:Inositol-tetrakisphosphate 1-kinase n=1 Tax=Rotaria socialis TaxID=392032 RepID=A0A818E8R7_9BILA|nr:unnamed protein product [Rotaria socialis]CAF3335115.1 unnamed protein product [Rotaria socialis]CAF3356183.1 unnamed protein product [Rotaria socialis]CAF3453349.1 unnamed protein product [Rotaria socialis]CAF3533495.1 unnamed protein product [Rotaria socialis]